MITQSSGSNQQSAWRFRPGCGLWIAVIASFCLVSPLCVHGAITSFLELGAQIKGESTDPQHTDEIDIITWGWGGSRDARGTISGGVTPPPKNVNAFFFTKRTDISTPDLILKCLSGAIIQEALLTVARSSPSGPLEFLEVKLKDVLVTSYDIEGDGGTTKALDTFHLKFDTIEVAYTEFLPDGREETSEVFWTVSTDTGGEGGNSGALPNTAPTISAITNKVTNEDTARGPISFTIDDAETDAGSLTLGRSSSNTTLLPLSGITFGGSGANRTVTLTPPANRNGTSSVVVTVSDGSKTASTNFTLTVNPINDPPSVTNPGAQVTQVDVPLSVNVSLSDIDTAINSVTLTGGEIPPNQQPLVANMTDTTGTGAVRAFSLVPVAGVTGTTTVVLNANDVPGSSTNTSFSLTINPPPGPSGPAAVLYDGLESTIPILVDEMTPAGSELGMFEALDDPGVEHEFLLLDDAGGAFGLGGPMFRNLVVLDDSLLDFETNPSLRIVVQARDLAIPERFRAEVFTIEVQNVNEPAAITLPASFGTVAPDFDFPLEGIAIDDPDSGSEDITVTFSVNDGYLVLDEARMLAGAPTGNYSNSVSVTAPLADINAVLTSPYGLYYRSDPSFSGTETLTVTTDDGGNSGPPGPQTDVASSSLEVDLTPWEIWRRANFTAAELDDPDISSFTADPDNDLLANGGEYGVGGAPKDPQSGLDLIQQTFVTTGGESYPALVFSRRTSDPNFAIDTQVSGALRGWLRGVAHTHEAIVDPIDGDFDRPTVRSNYPVSANPAQQLRLRFRLNTP